HEVENNSRASFAVVTASRTVRQPAVFGSTVTPSSRISDQNASPVLPPAASRRSDTVTISAPEARIAPCMIAGDGYSALPINRREENSRSKNFVWHATFHQ